MRGKGEEEEEEEEEEGSSSSQLLPVVAMSSIEWSIGVAAKHKFSRAVFGAACTANPLASAQTKHMDALRSVSEEPTRACVCVAHEDGGGRLAKCMESQGAVAHGSAARISGTARAPVASRASEIIFVGTVVNIVGYGRGFKRRFLRGRVAVPRCSSQHFRLLLSASSR